MRDINRIDIFCDILKKAWKMVPDWRFGQFVSNILGEGPMLFYREDNDSMRAIAEYFGIGTSDDIKYGKIMQTNDKNK